MKTYDVAILGGGPGGMAAADQAALRGARTCLIEADRLGGTCLNVGCIPTKAMLHASKLYSKMKGASEFGLLCGDVKVDGRAFMKRLHDVVGALLAALDKQYKAGPVELIRGSGRLADPHRIEVALSGGGQDEIEARSIIIATGSRAVQPEVFPFGSSRVMTTSEALQAQTLPDSALIVGGGVIGCEFATCYGELGIPTTLVEMLDSLLPNMDAEAAKLVQRSLRRRKVDVRLRTKIVRMSAGQDGIVAQTQDGKTVQAACALIAVGRRANVDGIGLDLAGVNVADGIIPVDNRCRTNVPHIYAVGDVAEKRQYAHLASRMGVVAAENATGHDVTDDRSAVPVGEFAHPEVACIGLSEAQARESFSHVRSATVQYQGSGAGAAYGEREGLVKIVADGQTGRLLGGLVIGYHGSDVLQELSLAVKQKLTVQQIAETIHIHPTFAEGVAIAAKEWLASARQESSS